MALTVCFLLTPFDSAGKVVTIGGNEINIPRPSGSVVNSVEGRGLIQDNHPYSEPRNLLVVTYVPKSLTGEVLNIASLAPRREYNIQTLGANQYYSYSKADFEGFSNVSKEHNTYLVEGYINSFVSSSYIKKLKSILKNQNSPLVNLSKKQMIRKAIALNSDFNNSEIGNLLMSFSDTINFEFNDDYKDYILFSSLFKHTYEDTNGVSVSSVVAATNAAVLIKGQVLYMNVHGNENDLMWTRAVLKKWMSELIDAN